MRTTPAATLAGARRSVRLGGVVLAMLMLVLAVLAPPALAEPPADTPPDQAAEPAHENAAGGEGNRGHIQLSSDGESFPPNNEPHLPCEFYVMFYDMREGTEQATVEFFAQPPSGGPDELLLSDTVVLNGEAGEGVTFNGSQLYDLEPYVGDLTYHEQQGYHIKLTVTTTPEDVSADQKHHVFWIDCAPAEEDQQPAPADLTVTKTVTGEDAPAADTEFEITIVCDELTEVVDLTDGETWSWNDDGTFDDLTEDSTCTVEETEDQDATSVTVTFNDEEIVQGDTQDLDAGTNTVVVTNDFTTEGGGGAPEAADLTVTKVVTGEEAPEDGTTFTIEVACDGDTQTAILADGDSWTWSEDAVDAEPLTEDSTCTIDETLTHDADVSVTFNGDDVDEGETLDLDAGDNTATVTNDFPDRTGVGGDENEENEQDEETGGEETQEVEEEGPIEVGVLPDEVERPAPTPGTPFAPSPAPVVEQPEQPAAAVQGVAAEQLPRTGVSSTALLVLALTLLGSGVTALRRTRPASAR